MNLITFIPILMANIAIIFLGIALLETRDHIRRLEQQIEQLSEQISQ